MVDLVVARFEGYFRHKNPDHDVLKSGDCDLACGNVRRALGMLRIKRSPNGDDDRLYDKALELSVKSFQQKFGHRVVDGCVGPETRALLVRMLLQRPGFDASIFRRLDRPENRLKPSVFLSYARADTERVNKLDQWLRDNGVYVLRDESDFEAGVGIVKNIERTVARSDKVIAVFSKHSRNRDWPSLERTIAEQLENQIKEPVLIYVRLDASRFSKHDPNRLAIEAEGLPLKDVGARILHALGGVEVPRHRYDYDENEPL